MKKIVVITGVSRGLGRSLVDRFVEKDWRVVGCARSAEAIEKLKILFPYEHDFQTVDISIAEEVEKWSLDVINRLGVPYLLINNAAIINKKELLWKTSHKEFFNVISTNLYGTFSAIRGFAPSMVETKEGIVVNVSSEWGKYGDALYAPYCASKFAIEGLTQSLAKELPETMVAVTLNPGTINTDMLQANFENAQHFISADQWSHKAISLLLNIKRDDNGKCLDFS